jgi:glycosyltransferase involved in cell wall biosynthesis
MKNIAYVCFRNPRFHYLHKAWVESVGAAFLESDYFSMSPRFFSRMVRKAWRFRNAYQCLLVVGGSGLQLAAWIKLFNPRVKLIYLNIDPLFYELRTKNRMKQAYLSWLASKIDAVISNSCLVEREIRRYVRCPSVVVEPFVRAVRARKPMPDRFVNLCFLGRLNREKQPRLVLDAFALVKKRNPRARLTFIGDGPLKAALERRAPSGVTFTGYLDNPAPLLATCGILVQPSMFESFGLSVLEAILCGAVPIVTRTMGVAERLPEELLIGGRSAHELAEKILHVQAKGNAALTRLNQRLQATVKAFTKQRSLAQFKSAVTRFCHG